MAAPDHLIGIQAMAQRCALGTCHIANDGHPGGPEAAFRGGSCSRGHADLAGRYLSIGPIGHIQGSSLMIHAGPMNLISEGGSGSGCQGKQRQDHNILLFPNNGSSSGSMIETAPEFDTSDITRHSRQRGPVRIPKLGLRSSLSMGPSRFRLGDTLSYRTSSSMPDL